MVCDSVSGRDGLIIFGVLAQCAAIPWAVVAAHARALDVLGDTETEAWVMESGFKAAGIPYRVYSDGGDEVPGLVRDHVRAGKVAFAWMTRDDDNPCRHWAHLHYEEDGSLAAATYPAWGGGYAYCDTADGRCAGTYICLDLEWTPALWGRHLSN